MKRFALFICLVIATSCRVGPEYERPVVETNDDWVVPISTEFDPPDDWWVQFNEPLLNNYVELARQYNNDVLVAEANIYEARAMRMVTAAALLPRIAADANANHYYFSKNGPLFAFSGMNPLPTIQIPRMQNIYNLNLDVLWEIDLFGKNRRKLEAAEANYEASIERRNDILISILAEVARNYIEIRSAQANGILIEGNIRLLEQNNAIVQERYRKGLTNSLDAKRLDAELAVARSALPDVIAQIYQGIYALSVLTGSPPETLLAEMSCVQPMPSAPECIAVGLRSDLLRRRPDVRYAERQLAAATANIGVAVASFFPTFTLNGLIGYQSLQLKNLISKDSETGSYGGDLLQPIFEGGRLVGNLEVSQADEQAAYYTYQQTVLIALQEAESALIAYTQELQTAQLLQESVAKTRDVSQLQNQRLKNGLVNTTDWLDSERQLISAEQSQLTSQTALLLDLVTLYKALGGGSGLSLAPKEETCN